MTNDAKLLLVSTTPKIANRLPTVDKEPGNIAHKIDWLSQNIENIIPAPLKGKFKGKYKLRIGDWRIVYSFENLTQLITVYAVRHRSEVYKT